MDTFKAIQRLEEIEKSLRAFLPTKHRHANAPIVYTPELGKAADEEWNKLWQEKLHLQAQLGW